VLNRFRSNVVKVLHKRYKCSAFNALVTIKMVFRQMAATQKNSRIRVFLVFSGFGFFLGLGWAGLGFFLLGLVFFPQDFPCWVGLVFFYLGGVVLGFLFFNFFRAGLGSGFLHLGWVGLVFFFQNFPGWAGLGFQYGKPDSPLSTQFFLKNNTNTIDAHDQR